MAGGRRPVHLSGTMKQETPESRRSPLAVIVATAAVTLAIASTAAALLGYVGPRGQSETVEPEAAPAAAPPQYIMVPTPVPPAPAPAPAVPAAEPPAAAEPLLVSAEPARWEEDESDSDEDFDDDDDDREREDD